MENQEVINQLKQQITDRCGKIEYTFNHGDEREVFEKRVEEFMGQMERARTPLPPQPTREIPLKYENKDVVHSDR